MNGVSFKKRLEYREFAIRYSWKGDNGSQLKRSAVGIEDDLNDRLELLDENLADASASKVLYEYGHQIYSNRRHLGKIIVFLKKGIRKLITLTLGWYIIPFLRRQSYFNAKALNTVALTHETGMRMFQRLNNEMTNLQSELTNMRNENSALKAQLEEQKQAIIAEKERSAMVLSELKTQIENQKNMLEGEKEKIIGKFRQMEYTPVEDEEFYHKFEERFRGDRETIKTRLQIYIPFLQKYISDFASAVFIDVGSGRGEWLDIIKTYGAVNYTGVDMNEVQNNICRSYGHNAVCADCIEYLSQQEDESIDVISGFQIIEHLYLYDFIELLKQCYRVLKKGGVILFETPNPRNIIVGAYTFYIDPSHHQPLTPELIELCAEWQGFSDVQIIPANSHELWTKINCSIDNQDLIDMTNQVNDIKWMLYGPQDYAVLGVKG